jgi:tRNA (adenine22-N1)-methyltransferase
MGGELISSILEAAIFVRNPQIRLVLQPMSSARELRLWLAENGFEIVEERFAAEKEKLYVVMCAHYTGAPYALSEVDSCVGTGTVDPLFGQWICRQIAAVSKQVNGLAKAGREDLALNALLKGLQDRLEEYERSKQ